MLPIHRVVISPIFRSQKQTDMRYLLLLIVPISVFAQPISTPRPLSPAISTTQTIGIAKTTISYSRPAVKGRKIWGELVPYGLNVQPFGAGNPAPWRAGANENTTINLSHDATIEGKKVTAGTYGLFFIVNDESSAELILSKNSSSWGSFYYDQSEDEMRAKIQVRDHEFTEWLTYDFTNLTKSSAELVLNWEKKQFPVKIEFAVDEIVMSKAKDELRGPAGFTPDAYITAAFYAFQNNVDLEQAMKWVDKALEIDPGNFDALRVKSRILVRNGRAAEADQMMKDAIAQASESDIINYSYSLINLGLHDKAINVLTSNTARFPKSANIFDSMGEAYALKGDKPNAIKSFKKALSMNPSANVKANSEKYLKELGAL
jgi:tetratricopeptide (TPR) repeat protein